MYLADPFGVSVHREIDIEDKTYRCYSKIMHSIVQRAVPMAVFAAGAIHIMFAQYSLRSLYP